MRIFKISNQGQHFNIFKLYAFDHKIHKNFLLKNKNKKYTVFKLYTCGLKVYAITSCATLLENKNKDDTRLLCC